MLSWNCLIDQKIRQHASLHCDLKVKCLGLVVWNWDYWLNNSWLKKFIVLRCKCVTQSQALMKIDELIDLTLTDQSWLELSVCHTSSISFVYQTSYIMHHTSISSLLNWQTRTMNTIKQSGFVWLITVSLSAWNITSVKVTKCCTLVQHIFCSQMWLKEKDNSCHYVKTRYKDTFIWLHDHWVNQP